MKSRRWVEDPAQKIWLPIAALFALFYFGEAILFWGPIPRFSPPAFTPLIYWGIFGATILFLLQRNSKKQHPRLSHVPEKFESTILAIAITAAVIGIPFLIIKRTGDITLGHVVLLAVMFLAGSIIGGMSGNLGWLVAALLWLAAAAFILCIPAKQDYTLGASVTLGFLAIGTFRQCAQAPPQDQ